VATDGHGRLVTVAVAAEHLGVSQRTVRRRIREGSLPAERVRTPHGHEWRVVADTLSTATVTTDHGQGRPRPANGHGQPWPGGRGHGQGTDDGALRQALDLVAAHAAKIASLEQERFELAGRLGYLQAQLAAKDEQLKALQAPKEPIAPPPPAGAIFRPLPADPDPPRRPWWRLLGLRRLEEPWTNC
jgi:excisionase family DNA binding protein